MKHGTLEGKRTHTQQQVTRTTMMVHDSCTYKCDTHTKPYVYTELHQSCVCMWMHLYFLQFLHVDDRRVPHVIRLYLYLCVRVYVFSVCVCVFETRHLLLKHAIRVPHIIRLYLCVCVRVYVFSVCVCVFETRDLLFKHVIRVPHALSVCACVRVCVCMCVCVCARDREYVWCVYYIFLYICVIFSPSLPLTMKPP